MAIGEKKAGFYAQWHEIKAKYNDCILFFRMGDFYEMFDNDAITASNVLDLVLTNKRCGEETNAPMCGVPHHSAQLYVAKLIDAGYKVAICEQFGEAKKVNGKLLIERDVVRVVTPGTVTESELLDMFRNNYLLAIYKNLDKIGVSYIDVSTGEFFVMPIKESVNDLTDLLTRIMPSEVIANKDGKDFYDELPIHRLGGLPKATEYYDWAFTDSRANENLQESLGENYLNVYELSKQKPLIYAAGAILEYIKETQKQLMKNINKLKVVRNEDFLVIDMNSRRNLELVETIRDRKKTGSLLNVVDKTVTPMGARKMRQYFDEPLVDSKEINLRLDAVEELVKRLVVRDRLSSALNGIRDIERLSGKIANSGLMPNEMLTIKQSLKRLPEVKETLADIKSAKLIACRENIIDFSPMVDLLEKAIVEKDCPSVLKDGGFIKDGFNAELDDYRNARTKGEEWIKELETKEIQATGIKNLKIGRNRVFGYFIEINRQYSNLVPLRYIRRQTIANNERYITDDLKTIEEKIVGADEKAVKLEIALFNKIREYMREYVEHIQTVSKAIAEIDTLLSFAQISAKYGYVKPVINNSIKHIKISEGRHPVVEAYLKNGTFIPNDTFINSDSDRTMIITGPNMAGKSTYMRQVAIITFLAHIGCFVPAKYAEIAITDRIFTRVGASDDLAFGQSTFMVEMSEVATILMNATDKSLVILDEIGRGTSTFDGLSIAWSVVEYISNSFKCKTLFATHYHELTDLEGVIDGVKNYKVAVKETDNSVVFLRKIVRGGANKSFGVEVARLAGLPQEVLDRANDISKNLEKVNTKLDADIFKDNRTKAEVNAKKAIALMNRIKDIDMNMVSPMSAFDTLIDLVNQAKSAEED